MNNKSFKKALNELEFTRKSFTTPTTEQSVESVRVNRIHYLFYDKIEIIKQSKGKFYVRCYKGGQEVHKKSFKSITKAEEWKLNHSTPIEEQYAKIIRREVCKWFANN